jgi:hypothetical protein
VQNCPPAARRAARHVFRPVIQVKNLRAAPSGEFLQRLVNFGVGLHGLDLVGKNVAVKIAEERKIPSDVLDGQVVGVRENVGRNAAPMRSPACSSIIGGMAVKMSAKKSPNSSIVPRKPVACRACSKNSSRVSRPVS